MDIDEIRRENLRELEKKLGAPAIAARAGMSLTQFYNLRDGAKDSKTGKRRGMRKETAQRLETACGLPVGYLDQSHSPETTEKLANIQLVRDGTLPDEIEKFFSAVEVLCMSMQSIPSAVLMPMIKTAKERIHKIDEDIFRKPPASPEYSRIAGHASVVIPQTLEEQREAMGKEEGNAG